MNKISLRIIFTLLIVTSISACKPSTQIPSTNAPPLQEPTQTLTSTTVQKTTVTSTSTQSPTVAPSHEPAMENPGWTTYRDILSIRDMVFDLDNNLWAVGPDGVIVLSPDGSQQHFTIEDGLPSNDLLSVGLDMQNTVWVGSNGSGAARFDGEAWQTFTTQDGLGGDVVLDIVKYIDHSGVLVGTNHGLSEYDTEKWQNYAGTTYLPDDDVRIIVYPPHEDTFWVGTRQGVKLFATTQTYTSADGLASNEVNAGAFAPDCSLWVGTSGGASHFNGATWTSYTTADGLADDLVTAMAISLDGVAWFGTHSGLSRFDGNSWATFTTDDGLADNDVLSIVVAPNDTLWIGTVGGLSNYSPSLALHPDETVQSTSGAQESDPRLLVAYEKDDNLWIWNAGVKKQLTNDGHITGMSLSSDGRKVAFTRWVGNYYYELWVMNQDGSDERLLVSQDDLAELGKFSETEEIRQSESHVSIRDYEWVPGTYMIAYGTHRSIRYDGTIEHNDLNLVDAETGEKTALLPPGRGGTFTYSPDGSHIAIVGENQISIVNADGSDRLDKLLEYPTIHDVDGPFYPKPVWSPDGKYLLLALPPENPLYHPTEPTTLWQIPADGSPAIRLGSINPSDVYAFFVWYSPDRTHLAYWVRVDEQIGGKSEIHIAKYDGTDDKIARVGQFIYFVDWSLDGQHFADYSHPKPDAWYISDLDGNSTLLPYMPVRLRWVSDVSFLHLDTLGCAYELRLTSLNGESQVIDRMWSGWSFDFIYR